MEKFMNMTERDMLNILEQEIAIHGSAKEFAFRMAEVVTVREGPILMTPANGQKCFDGTKTHTRRIISSPSRKHDHFVLLEHESGFWPYLSDDGESSITDDGNETPIKCPHGVVGSHLWVREACWIWGMWISGFDEERKRRTYSFQESYVKQVTFTRPDRYVVTRKQPSTIGWVRRPGIFMPRWACRTVLEITEVRVEQLQDITQLDALHEGCEGPDHKATFFRLWESINGPGSWKQNPYVWCLSFRKVNG
ncbi:MAG: hypothetical protein ACRCZI_11350 [Cetobacterium sp.]